MECFNWFPLRIGIEPLVGAADHRDILQRVAIDQQDVGQRAFFDHTLLAGLRIARAGQGQQLTSR